MASLVTSLGDALASLAIVPWIKVKTEPRGPHGDAKTLRLHTTNKTGVPPSNRTPPQRTRLSKPP